MAPVGSRESLAAAIQAGADSIYFGIENLNMRARSANTFTVDDLREIARTCDEHGMKSYLTVNTIIYDKDIPLMRTIVDAAKAAGISAVIAADVAVMCGPSHAEEVGIGLPTTVVAGARKKSVAEGVQDIFMNEVFRVYTSPDVLGMELGGSLKNVIALAAGMADGLGYGDNTKAALITRGIAEIAGLAVKMGAKVETLCGLTGIGDLIVTCESRHSRNRKAGMLIGQGYTMKQATDEVKMVVEGIYSAKAALALAKKYDVELPIIEEVNKVLFDDKPAKEGVKDLMVREKRVEHLNLKWEN